MRKFGFGLLSVAALGTLSLMVAAISGCGDKELFDTIEIPVTVTKNGAPLADVVVTFYPYDDPNAPPSGKAVAAMAMTQKTDADGKGIVKIAKGKYLVAFRSNKSSGDAEGVEAQNMVDDMKAMKLSSNQGEGAGKLGRQDSESLINARYNDPKTTGFEPFDVSDSNKEKGFTFDLVD